MPNYSNFIFIMDQNIIIWNCQGAASKRFRMVAKKFVVKHKPRILVMLVFDLWGCLLASLKQDIIGVLFYRMCK